MTFRIPHDIKRYLMEEKERSGREMTRVVLEALELDRDLDAMLSHEGERLQRFADTHQIDLPDDLPKALGALIKRGLDASTDADELPATKSRKR